MIVSSGTVTAGLALRAVVDVVSYFATKSSKSPTSLTDVGFSRQMLHLLCTLCVSTVGCYAKHVMIVFWMSGIPVADL